MIDNKLQAELRARFNPDGSELRRYQLYLLEMLKDFDALCRKHDIKYWLSSGTCLGAVRHGGFIPWDDDLDVEMDRKDYQKLLKVFQEDERYVLQHWGNDRYYCFSFAKFRDKRSIIKEVRPLNNLFKERGAYIDIFPMEKTVQWLSMVCFYSTLPIPYLYSRQIYPRFKKRPYVLEFMFDIWKFLTFNGIRVASLIGRILCVGKEYGHGYGSPFYKFKRCEQDVEHVRNIKFEDAFFPVPEKFEDYLSRIYGDYMKLPSLDTIHPHLSSIEQI